MNWTTRRIGEEIQVLSGFAFDSKLFSNEKGTPLIRIRDVIRGCSETFYQGKYDVKYIVERGDILIGMDGEFNIARWQGEPALLNQRVCKISISNIKKLSSKYLYYALPKKLKEIEARTPFVTVKHLSVNDIKKIEIPFPPLHIQQQIADTLDKADALRQKDQQLLQKYDELAQSIFYDMFGDPISFQNKWESYNLEEVCTHIVDCPHSTPSYTASVTQFPCIRTSELINGEIRWKTMKYLQEPEYIIRIARLKPEQGDIIYGREGTFGDAIIVPNNCKISLGQRTMLFRPNRNLVNSTYFWFHVRSPFVYHQALKKNTGSIVGHVNIADIRRFKVIIPSIELQNDFENRLLKIKRLRELTTATLDCSNLLFDGMMKSYYQ